ncbi:hypothetical protein ACFLTN_07745, partial [Chloroflexota bacterium]
PIEVMNENVILAVCVARNEVAGIGPKGDIAAVVAYAGPIAAFVALGAIGGDTDPGGMRIVDTNKDVSAVVCVTGNEVAGMGPKGDIAAVAAYVATPAVTVALGAIGGDADPGGDTRIAVMNEDVIMAVCVTRNEVAGIGPKGDVETVTAYAGLTAATFALVAKEVDADLGGGIINAVMHKDVRKAKAVTGNEVAGRGFEGDIAAVTAYAGPRAVTVALGAIVGETDPGGMIIAVTNKDVIAVVCVTGNELAGRGPKGDIAAVAAYAGPRAVTVALGAIDRDTDQLYVTVGQDDGSSSTQEQHCHRQHKYQLNFHQAPPADGRTTARWK